MSDFKSKMHQIQFRQLRPRPRWGAYSAPPDPLSGFKDLLLREGRRGKEKERRGWGRGGGWEGRKRRGGWEGGGRKGRGKGRGCGGAGKWSAPGPVLALGGPDYADSSDKK